MDTLLIDSNFLRVGIVLTVPLVLFGVTFSIFVENTVIEWIFALCKAIFYYLLCFTVYKAFPYYYENGKIGAILAITFVVSCLEIGDNTVRVLKGIIGFGKTIYSFVKSDNHLKM